MALYGEDWKTHVGELATNHAVLGVFTTPGGGTVVNAGVTDWACGLGDPDVDRITRTVLDRLSREGADMRWDAFAQAAPRIAAMAEERFRKDGLAVLGTI